MKTYLCLIIIVSIPLTAVDKVTSQKAVSSLRIHLNKSNYQNLNGLIAVKSLPMAKQALTKADAQMAAKYISIINKKRLKQERQNEMTAKVIQIGELKMPFAYKVFGDKPKDGRSLYISMHGGGGGPASMNDQQWQNQIRLYQPKEGVYLAPRAPTNTWDLWHLKHIDDFFLRIIENMTIFESVDPNKVYLMGYSAGGDGVYQLAPRMAYRYAAAAMMAGHPNETSPLGLRNLPFILQVGEQDNGYNRNQVAVSFGEDLNKLAQVDKGAYINKVIIHKGMGHWMNLKDALALP